MQESQKNNPNSNNNNSKNNLIGLAIFVGMFIIIIIVIVILTKSILPSSGSSSSSMLVADSNLGIHTDTTTEPVTASTNKNSSQNSSDNDEYNGGSTNQQGTKMTVKSSVNVRSGPGSDNTQIGEISAGTEITVYENVSGWYRILFNGSTDAYVYSSYVEGELPETSSQSTTDAYSADAAAFTSDYAQYGQLNSFADTSEDYNY